MIFFLSSIYFYMKSNSKLQMVMKDVCGHEFLSAHLHLHTECSVLLIHLTCLLKKTLSSSLTHTQATIDGYTHYSLTQSLLKLAGTSGVLQGWWEEEED